MNFRPRLFILALLGLLLTTAGLAASSNSPTPDKKDLMSWPRAKADRFGCFLEKDFGVKDPKFNCDLKNYVNQGDPCKNTKAYYEGPTFPEGKAPQVNPLVKSIGLSWEHGDLQGVDVTLGKKMSEEAVKKAFNLPSQEGFPRPNVMNYSIQQCSANATCIVIQGFDHQGAGDVDCGEQ